MTKAQNPTPGPLQSTRSGLRGGGLVGTFRGLLNYSAEMVLAILPADRLSSRLKSSVLRWRGAKVGRRAKLFRNVWVDGYSGLSIGDEVFINHGCLLHATGGIRIESGALLGPGVTILSADHADIGPGGLRRSEAILKPVVVGAGAWLGGCCVLTPGVSIGKGAIVAAGAVVTKDVPARAVVGGVPARVLRTRTAGETAAKQEGESHGVP